MAARAGSELFIQASNSVIDDAGGGAAGVQVAGANGVSTPPLVRHGCCGLRANATRLLMPPRAPWVSSCPTIEPWSCAVKTPVMKRAMSCSCAGVRVGVHGVGDVG